MPGRVVQFPNVVRQARGAAGQSIGISRKDIENPDKLVDVLNAIGRVVYSLTRFVDPPFVEFEDVDVPGGAAEVTLPHGLGGRVRWWVTDWTCTSAATPILRKLTSKTTNDVLVLLSNQVGTATIRVQALP